MAGDTYAKPTTEKLIPKNMWIGFREIPPEGRMYPHMKEMMASARHDYWMINMVDDKAIDDFMFKYYRDSSIFWAFQLINPRGRIAAADIWRYAALYAFGGFYIDDDAYIKTPLDQIIQAKDRLILAVEGNPNTDCYVPSYNLSNAGLQQLYPLSSTSLIFDGKSVVQWGIFAAPGHPIFLKLLSNIVDVITFEYFKRSVILPSNIETKYLVVICATGPGIMTSTILAELLRMKTYNHSEYDETGYRIAGKDYADYGGVYKIENFEAYSATGTQHKHFSTYLKRHGIHLLRQYYDSALHN